jgi:hypothetical protein
VQQASAAHDDLVAVVVDALAVVLGHEDARSEPAEQLQLPVAQVQAVAAGHQFAGDLQPLSRLVVGGKGPGSPSAVVWLSLLVEDLVEGHPFTPEGVKPSGQVM